MESGVGGGASTLAGIECGSAKHAIDSNQKLRMRVAVEARATNSGVNESCWCSCAGLVASSMTR